MSQNRIDWLAVIGFSIVIVIIAGLFVWAESLPVDKDQVSAQISSLSSLIAETELIIENSYQQPEPYTKAHLEDLHENVKMVNETLRSQKYSSDVSDKKEAITDLSNDAEETLGKLAESWESDKDHHTELNELKKLYSLSQTLSKQL